MVHLAKLERMIVLRNVSSILKIDIVYYGYRNISIKVLMSFAIVDELLFT